MTLVENSLAGLEPPARARNRKKHPQPLFSKKISVGGLSDRHAPKYNIKCLFLIRRNNRIKVIVEKN